MSAAPDSAVLRPAAAAPARRRLRLPPEVLGIGLAALVAAPLLAVVVVAADPSQGGEAIAHLTQTVLPRYLLNTLLLAAVVLAVVLVAGVGTGWAIAAYDFPGRAWLRWALVLPLAMPAFVMAYAYTDFLDVSGPFQGWVRELTGWPITLRWFPDLRTLPGAGLFLGLALYPYVYLLARAAFAERSASLGEAACSLGVGGRRAWWRVVWPVARPAVAAGCALVLMETFADFGTVSYFGVETLTAGIFRAWQGFGDRVAAARIALVLLALVAAIVWLERHQRERMRFFARAPRPAARRRVGGGRGLALAVACALPVLLGFVLPVVLLVRAWAGTELHVDPRLGAWWLNTLVLAAAAVAVILPAALAMAYALRLAPSRPMAFAAAASTGGYALPGIVIGIGLLVTVGVLDDLTHPLFVVGGTAGALVWAYAVRFFAVGFHGLDAALRRIGPSMDQSARSLGLGPWQVLARVHWPLLRPSLATGALLVAVDCLKELPATLVLRPLDFDTLAVVAYHFAKDERLAESALPSLLIVLAGLLPVLLLDRVADRPRGR